VTHLIGALKAGRDDAFDQLCVRLLPQLTSYADRRHGGSRVGLEDGEDIAQRVFLSLWHAVEGRGRFLAQLSDRQSLWRVLVVLTSQKVRRVWRDGTRKKRDCRRTLLSSDAGTDGVDPWDTCEAASPEPGADLIIQETIEEWLTPLTENQRVIASLKLVAATNPEIAAHLGISVRSVERELSEIRSLWEERYETVTGRPPSR
jgi:RNA polymerase sigma factor (sigma-70 family)